MGAIRFEGLLVGGPQHLARERPRSAAIRPPTRSTGMPCRLRGPWFCLTEPQRAELRALVESVKASGGDDGYRRSRIAGWWSMGQNVHTWTGEGSADSPPWQALIKHFEVLSSVHVWGQSPEDDARELDTPRVVSLTVGGSA